MKRRLLLSLPLVGFIGLAIFLYMGLSMDPFGRDSARLSDAFPSFELSTLDDPDRRVDESLFEGEVTLVNVWGEWCPTCKQEMPQLLDLADRGIRLVGINYKDTRDKGREFLDEFGNPFEVNIFDPEGDLGFELGVYGAPETFLVDADGIIRYHHTGYIKPEDVRDTILPEVEKWQ
ncbi:DsbE family thiol:disulfide interchange protein [Aidingimonas halophila]|uniref:Cytochrome c biogenesis protein CcmG, thiol:disulfide interchange protein DsbE n=1 Tax=Aidingimonas halophila TaxID=574349 RepID=A0A1H2V8D6_9GAMM|nr:DsbE family thiol:disulfide interchange protein [Aidingimonas halophila]GHC23939.1 thiol:disulfide interchange protein DsbE [Aidingimonas halophila]SDW64545.1 cytochrome c biogenesis protein CcmG, thiol:disulfide interchange protein DsbE [Aidingimonas halophila]